MSQPEAGQFSIETFDFKILKELVTKKTRVGNQVAVVFDSLSPLLLHQTVGAVCQLVLQTSTEYLLSMLVHSDVHEDGVIANVEHMCSTVLNVKSVQIAGYDGQVQIRHLRKSGKILKSVSVHCILWSRYIRYNLCIDVWPCEMCMYCMYACNTVHIFRYLNILLLCKDQS